MDQDELPDLDDDPGLRRMMEEVIRATTSPVNDPEFVALGESRSVLEVTLKGHLFIEREMIRALETALPFPEYVRLERMPFSAKLDLMAALRLLVNGIRPGIQAFNSARNRMAHRLDGENLLDIAAVNAQLPPSLREVGAEHSTSDVTSQVIVLCIKLIIACRVGYVLAKSGFPHVLSSPAEDWWTSL